MHLVVSFLHSAALALGLFAAVNAVLWLAWMGNPRLISFVLSIRRTASILPATATFTCKGRAVSTTFYDPRNDEDHTANVFTFPFMSFLTWRGGPRSARRMSSAANKELALRLGLFTFAFIPLVAMGVWLAMTADWTWIFALGLFLEWQAISAYLGGPIFLKFGAISGFVAVIFLHETGWLFHPTLRVSLIIGGIWAAIIPTILIWVRKADASSSASSRLNG